MGLTPKHRNPAPKLGWEALNKTLKATIDESNFDEPNVIITLTSYSMEPEEIISELTKNGYKVSKTADSNKIIVR